MGREKIGELEIEQLSEPWADWNWWGVEGEGTGPWREPGMGWGLSQGWGALGMEQGMGTGCFLGS